MVKITRARDNATQGGLVLVNSTDFTTASTVSVNNCFTSTYRNYRVIITIDSATSNGATVDFRYRTNGTDNSTNNYFQASYRTNAGGTSGAYWYTNQVSSMSIMKVNADVASASLDITNPQIAKSTMMGSVVPFPESGVANWATALNSTVFGASTQFDGFSLLPSAGTLTGNLKVYGYRN